MERLAKIAEHAPSEKIGITDEMIDAAAQVLLAESALDLMTEGWAWGLARQMLECALALVGSQRRVRDDKPDEGAGEGP